MSTELRGMEQEGGKRAKWDRLHQREMGEVKEACEGLVGRTLSVGEMGPVWDCLNRWARHRYWTARKHPAGEGRKVSARTRVELMAEPAPEDARRATRVPTPEEEKLPWED